MGLLISNDLGRRWNNYHHWHYTQQPAMLTISSLLCLVCLWKVSKHSTQVLPTIHQVGGGGVSQQQNAHAFASGTPNARIRRLTCPQLTSRRIGIYTHRSTFKTCWLWSLSLLRLCHGPLYYRWINPNMEHLLLGTTVAQNITIWITYGINNPMQLVLTRGQEKAVRLTA